MAKKKFKPGQRLTLNIKYEDLLFGERGNNEECPLAKAFSRQFDCDAVVPVNFICWTNNDDGVAHCGRLSQAGRDYVENIDKGNVMKPARFTVTVLE